MFRHITKPVWILSFVSLLTDTASEMLYPIMPIYLQTIGFSVLLIGILEGVAEATAGLSKGYFGKLSDNSGKRVAFVQVGYALSALSKPMVVLFAYPVWIFFVRTIDRFGKGIRTGARDAILSAEATPETKGRVFGFHRSMDTLGAVAGPSFALVYLYLYPHQYHQLFYIAFLPGVLAVLAAFLLKEKATPVTRIPKATSFFSFLQYWKESPPTYRTLVRGLLAFALLNSSDVFLILKARQTGLSDSVVIGLYIFYNLVYALASYPIGRLADKIGFRTTLIAGLSIFAMVYLSMAVADSLYVFIGLFFMYGLYAAATEGVAKAWISNISDKKDAATALGTFAGFQSICALGASSLAGFSWYAYGSGVTFFVTAIGIVFVVLYFIFNRFDQLKL